MTSTLGPDGPTLHEAEERYHRDPMFHARVHAAVTALRIDLHGRPTGRLSEREQAIAKQAAALGLLMADFDPTPGTVAPPVWVDASLPPSGDLPADLAEMTRIATAVARRDDDRIRAILIAQDIDPDDRTPGWEARARAALEASPEAP